MGFLSGARGCIGGEPVRGWHCDHDLPTRRSRACRLANCRGVAHGWWAALATHFPIPERSSGFDSLATTPSLASITVGSRHLKEEHPVKRIPRAALVAAGLV